jgi:hypothetical protein
MHQSSLMLHFYSPVVCMKPYIDFGTSITCRRRHVKCDETRPHCHRCMKGGQTCIYAENRPDTAGRTESRVSLDANLDAPPAPTRQPVPQWQSSPEQTIRYAQPLLENGNAGTIGTPNHHGQQSNTSSNSIAIGSQTNMSPDGAAQQQVMSPEMSQYAATAFSLGSNDTGSLVARSVSSRPTFNVAITRWFDMLVGDSTFENGFSDFDIGLDETNNLDTPQEQDRNSVPYMGPFNNVAPTTGLDATSPASSCPQLLERSAPGPDRNAISEKLKWQAPAAIELLPYEHLIFRNFVQRISHWVSIMWDILISIVVIRARLTFLTRLRAFQLLCLT